MTDRKQDHSVTTQNANNQRVIAAAAVFTPPSKDEEAFLEDIARTSEGYDPKVVVGGPRKFST
jgi:hypothetical protein